MKRKLAALLITIGFIGAVLGQACSDYSMMGTDESSSLEALTITPDGSTIAPGAQLQLTPSGGNPPYSCQMDNSPLTTSASGAVSSAGLYTAPLTTTALTATVECSDSVGRRGYANIFVTGNTFNPSYTPNPASPGNAIVINPNVAGRTASDFRYQLLQGAGTLNGNTYTAPSASETARIHISDPRGMSATLSIPIGTTGVPAAAVGAIAITSPGRHVVGGGGSCPDSTWVASGMVADGGGGYLQGDQLFCSRVIAASTGTRILTHLRLTDGGGHAATPACPAGYESLGYITDCVGGGCSGEQTLCGLFATMAPGVRPVLEFKVTPEGLRAQGGAPCDFNNTFEAVGYAADCQYGTCSGYQTFCIRR